jgi:hypothetical protein
MAAPHLNPPPGHPLAPQCVPPIVSIVIPTRGRPLLLARAIRSVLAQSLQAFEIIIVLDGEDAETEKAVHSFADPRIFLHKLIPAAGGAAARNAGVNAAFGQWVAFLDDDDEFLPAKLEMQLAAAQRTSSVSTLVVSQAFARSSNGEQIWPSRFPAPGESICEYLFCRNQLRQGTAFLQSSTFFVSRELALKVPFRAHLKRHQDWDWVIHILSAPGTNLICIPEPLSIYHREQPPAASSSAPASVSRRTGWQESLDWAREVVLPQSRSAYAFFVATQCVTRLRQSERLDGRVFLLLARECFLIGNSNLFSTLLFLAFWMRSFGIIHRFPRVMLTPAPHTVPSAH